MLREPFAEFAGVMILIIFGVGVDCQVVLTGDPTVSSGAKGVRSIEHSSSTDHTDDSSIRNTSPSTLVGQLVSYWFCFLLLSPKYSAHIP
jgi:glycerol uptake facilitator-like aquaporin